MLYVQSTLIFCPFSLFINHILFILYVKLFSIYIYIYVYIYIRRQRYCIPTKLKINILYFEKNCSFTNTKKFFSLKGKGIQLKKILWCIIIVCIIFCCNPSTFKHIIDNLLHTDDYLHIHYYYLTICYKRLRLFILNSTLIFS